MIPRFLFVIVIAAICMFGGYGIAVLNRSDEPAKLETKAAFKDRYFFVTFRASDGAFGNMGYNTKHGEWPGNKELKDFLLKEDNTLKTICIWSITEWNETQYNQFWDK